VVRGWCDFFLPAGMTRPSTPVVAVHGVGLVQAAPARPVEDGLRRGQDAPDQAVDEATQVAPAHVTADAAPETLGQPRPLPTLSVGRRAGPAAPHTRHGAGRARRRDQRCGSAARCGHSSRPNSRSRRPRPSPSCRRPAARGSANGCARPDHLQRASAYSARRR
jgi:hypothetical protein